MKAGASFDVVSGVDVTTHGPIEGYAPSRELDAFQPFQSHDVMLQLGVRYGWRFSRGQALQLGFSVGSFSSPTLGGYWQFLDGPVDAGAGVTAGLGMSTVIVPSVYGMLGHGFQLGEGTELRLDAGYRYTPAIKPGRHQSSSHGPMGLVSFARGTLSIGAWMDHLSLDHTVFRGPCDDACDKQDTMSSLLGGGLFLSYSP